MIISSSSNTPVQKYEIEIHRTSPSIPKFLKVEMEGSFDENESEN